MTKINPDAAISKVATSRIPAPAADRVVTSRDNRPDPAVAAVAEFDDALAQRDGLDDRIARLLAAAPRAVAIDADTAGRCTELARQLGAVVSVIEDARKTAKEPYLAAGRAVDAAARVRAEPLEAAKGATNAKLTDYLREERARAEAEQRRQEEARRAQEAEQRAAEEAARAANLPPPEPMPVIEAAPPLEPVQVRGDYGSVASGATVWRHEITDLAAAFPAVAGNARVREAIDKALAALVRSGVREIAGVRIWSDISARVR